VPFVPNPFTGVFCCGFECSNLYVNPAPNLAHWPVTTGFSMSTSTVRTGGYSLRLNPAAAATRIACLISASTNVVARFYIRFATLPDADTYIAGVGLASSTVRIGIGFKQSDSKLYCATGSTVTFGATGVGVTTGVWYLIDLKMDQTTGAKVVDAQVDGVALGQHTSTQAGGAGSFSFGTGAETITADIFYDDFALSHTAVDYPIGAGRIDHFVPTADGTHNTGTAGTFIVGAAGANITDATTDSYLLVDDVPYEDDTPGTDDYINQAAIGAANYVEHIFGPAPGVSTPTVAPRTVEVLSAVHQQSTSIGASVCKINDNGTEDTIGSVAGAGQTTPRHFRKHYAVMPADSLAWDIARFNNLRHRFGYSTDAAPDQYFDCAMLEAEFQE